MTRADAAERLLASIDWASFGAAHGNGERVRRGLAELLASESGEAAQRSYWNIENVAFVQGELFAVSEACISVLIASLVDAREIWVRIAALELMFQILSGYASARPATPIDIVQRCQRKAREGLWLLHREAISGLRDAAFDVLDLLGEGEASRKLVSLVASDEKCSKTYR